MELSRPEDAAPLFHQANGDQDAAQYACTGTNQGDYQSKLSHQRHSIFRLKTAMSMRRDVLASGSGYRHLQQS